MENIINVHVEKLPEGYYLVTSEDVQGLVAQGRTVSEALEIARDVTRRLLESQSKKKKILHLKPIKRRFDSQLVIGG